MDIVGCISSCDDDAATLLGGLACAVAVWVPDPGAGILELPKVAANILQLFVLTGCAALMALAGWVLLFWKLTLSLPLRSTAARDLLLVQPTLEKMPRGDALSKLVCTCQVCTYGRICTSGYEELQNDCCALR